MLNNLSFHASEDSIFTLKSKELTEGELLHFAFFVYVVDEEPNRISELLWHI